jgi:uncharacterized protein with FMN-binding domain
VARDSTVKLTTPAPELKNMTPAVALALPNAPKPINVAAIVAPSAASQAVVVPPAPAQPAAAPPVQSSAAPAPQAPAQQAPAPAAAAPAPAAPAAAPAKAGAKVAYKDGFHFGRGTSRHGDIGSMIEIVNGRIVSVVISECLTQYSCRWIAALPGQVVARQSADVDYVTGATESANAFYFSIVQALMQAK